MGVWSWITGKSGKQQPESESAPASPGSTGTAVLDPGDGPASEPAAAAAPAERWWARAAGEGLTQWVAPSGANLSTEARALENALVSQFDGHNLSVPNLPRVPELVLRQLRSRKCDFGKVAEAIAEDQVTAGAVIRMANSPIYGGMNKISALQPAVTRLGLNALRTLMMQQSLHAATFHGRGGDKELASMVWNRALASAWVMRFLGPLVELDEEEAFLLGLLHDIGTVVVLREAQNQYSVLHSRVGMDAFEYLSHQTHQEFGELIAQAWQLPADLAEVIGDHHKPPAADDPLRVRRHLVQLTEMIIALLGYAPWGAYDLHQAEPAVALGLPDRPDWPTFLDELPDRLDGVLSPGG